MRSARFLKQVVASAALVLANAQVLAADPVPRILREPVLGLRYDRAQVKFDPLPPQAIANCETLADNEHSRAVWYVYGQARDASGRTFYVTGGYEVRLDGPPTHRRFLTEDLGLVVHSDAQTCEPGESARDTFDQRIFDNTLTPSILKQLAFDVVRRLERAFGGTDRLKLELELHHQRVNLDALPPELRDAMKAYITQPPAADAAPHILREPVLGLRYERPWVKFDPMPAQVVANCADLANNKLSKPVWYVYGKTRDASGRSFYVTGGYLEMLDGRPKVQRCLTEQPGMMFYIDTRICQSLDPPVTYSMSFVD